MPSGKFLSLITLTDAYWLGWSLVIFFSPTALGFLAAYFSQKEILRKILQWIGFNPIHVIPTGWDYKFSRIEKASWILVTLKDGSSVAGLFGSRSFASSESSERDLYIEKIYKVNNEKPWEPVERSDGILIRGDQIKHIEFWSGE